MALRKWNFEDYSLPYGQHFLTNVLTDLWKKEKKEFIYLDRNLKIFRQNKHDILLGEEVTRPSEFFFITTVCENDPTLFKVKLRHEPEAEPICDLPLLKDNSLTVFHWYTKASGKSYEAHNYPLECFSIQKSSPKSSFSTWLEQKLRTFGILVTGLFR